MQKRSTMPAICRDEELALFLDMHKKEQRDNKKSYAIYPLPHDADPSLLVGSKSSFMPHLMASQRTLMQTSKKPADDTLISSSVKKADDLLTADLGKNDYDWLLTPPGTPLINPLDHSFASNVDDFKSHTSLFSSVGNLTAIKTSCISSSKTTETNKKKEPPADGHISRKAFPAVKKGQKGRTFSRSNASSSNGAMMSSRTSLSRSSSRSTSPNSIPSTHASHPTTPTNRSKVSSKLGSHPTTPPSRATTALISRSGGTTVAALSNSKNDVSCQPMTPLRGPSAPQTLSQPVTRSSSIIKTRPLPSRSAPSSRGSSPIAKPREGKQRFACPAISLEASSRSTSLASPPTTNSRGFLGATTSTTQALSSTTQSEAIPDISRRKSCSPSLFKGKSALLGISRVDKQNIASIAPMNRLKSDKSLGDMVSRGIFTNVPDKRTLSKQLTGSSLSLETAFSRLQTKHLLGKSVSPTTSTNNDGLVRNGPRKSLYLTMQNLNLQQNNSNGLCSLVSTSPLLSYRHVDALSRLNNSFTRTSSNASQDCSMIMAHDPGNEVGEDCVSSCKASPTSQPDLLSLLVEDASVNDWLASAEYMDEGPELMRVFQQGVDKFQSCESPLVCPHGGGAMSCELCNVKMRLQMLNEKCKVNFGADSWA